MHSIFDRHFVVFVVVVVFIVVAIIIIINTVTVDFAVVLLSISWKSDFSISFRLFSFDSIVLSTQFHLIQSKILFDEYDFLFRFWAKCDFIFFFFAIVCFGSFLCVRAQSENENARFTHIENHCVRIVFISVTWIRWIDKPFVVVIVVVRSIDEIKYWKGLAMTRFRFFFRLFLFVSFASAISFGRPFSLPFLFMYTISTRPVKWCLDLSFRLRCRCHRRLFFHFFITFWLCSLPNLHLKFKFRLLHQFFLVKCDVAVLLGSFRFRSKVYFQIANIKEVNKKHETELVTNQYTNFANHQRYS